MFVKSLVGAVLIGFMAIGFYLLSWQGYNQQLISLDRQIADEKAKYDQYQQEAQNLERWEAAKVAFENVLASMHQTASIKNFIPSFLTDIEKLAAEERESTDDPNFRVLSISPGTVQTQGPANNGSSGSGKGGQKQENNASSSEALPVESGTSVIQLNFTGRFSTIVDFLQQLGNFKLNKLVTIQKISLSPQNALPGESPILSVGMPFQVYMLGGG